MNDEIEAVARAIKASIGEQWDATPIPMPPDANNWTATGGTLDLLVVAKAAIAALDAQPDRVALVRDAERWKYAEDNLDIAVLHRNGGWRLVSTDEIDAAIDSALVEGEGHE